MKAWEKIREMLEAKVITRGMAEELLQRDATPQLIDPYGSDLTDTLRRQQAMVERMQEEYSKHMAVWKQQRSLEEWAAGPQVQHRQEPPLTPIPPPSPSMKRAQSIMSDLWKIARLRSRREREWAVAQMAGVLLELVKAGEKEKGKDVVQVDMETASATGATIPYPRHSYASQNIGLPSEGGTIPNPRYR